MSARKFSKFLIVIFYILLSGSVISTVFFIFKTHPHQGSYVNIFAGERRQLDYWGLSYRNIVEHLLKTNPGVVKIHFRPASPGRINRKLLPASDRKRIKQVREPDADYIVTTFRRYEVPPGYEEYYTVKIGKRVIGGAYRKSDG
jgi:hypothetical protein